MVAAELNHDQTVTGAGGGEIPPTRPTYMGPEGSDHERQTLLSQAPKLDLHNSLFFRPNNASMREQVLDSWPSAN